MTSNTLNQFTDQAKKTFKKICDQYDDLTGIHDDVKDRLNKVNKAMTTPSHFMQNTSQASTTQNMTWYNNTNIVSGQSSNTAQKIVIQGNNISGGKINVGTISQEQRLRAISGHVEVVEGREATIDLPNGEVLEVDEHGNLTLKDDDAQVTYRAARSRAFNPFVNAADLMGEFIEYLGTVRGVTRDDVPQLPLRLFVHWLVIRAAERDGDPVPDDIEDPQRSRALTGRVRPQCALPTCRRFIPHVSAENGFNHCGGECAARHHEMLKAA